MRAYRPCLVLVALAMGGCLFKPIVVADASIDVADGGDISTAADRVDIVDVVDAMMPMTDVCVCPAPPNDERAGAIQVVGWPAMVDAGTVDANADAAPSDGARDAPSALDVSDAGGSDASATPGAWGAVRVPGATTVGATHSVDAPCDSTRGGADVWYRVDLLRREVVYADTLGASWRTLLLLTDASGTPLSRGTTTNTTCDANTACVHAQGSQVVALLDAGTYYLVLSGVGTDTGTVDLHVKHVAAGAGAVAVLGSGVMAITGSLAASGDALGLCPALATGASDTYWWVTCPSDTGGQLTATACPTSFSNVNVIYVDADLGPLCNSAQACGFNAGGMLGNLVSSGEGLHALYVIERSAGSNGSYSLMTTRP